MDKVKGMDDIKAYFKSGFNGFKDLNFESVEDFSIREQVLQFQALNNTINAAIYDEDGEYTDILSALLTGDNDLLIEFLATIFKDFLKLALRENFESLIEQFKTRHFVQQNVINCIGFAAILAILGIITVVSAGITYIALQKTSICRGQNYIKLDQRYFIEQDIRQALCSTTALGIGLKIAAIAIGLGIAGGTIYGVVTDCKSTPDALPTSAPTTTEVSQPTTTEFVEPTYLTTVIETIPYTTLSPTTNAPIPTLAPTTTEVSQPTTSFTTITDTPTTIADTHTSQICGAISLICRGTMVKVEYNEVIDLKQSYVCGSEALSIFKIYNNNDQVSSLRTSQLDEQSKYIITYETLIINKENVIFYSYLSLDDWNYKLKILGSTTLYLPLEINLPYISRGFFSIVENSLDYLIILSKYSKYQYQVLFRSESSINVDIFTISLSRESIIESVRCFAIDSANYLIAYKNPNTNNIVLEKFLFNTQNAVTVHTINQVVGQYSIDFNNGIGRLILSSEPCCDWLATYDILTIDSDLKVVNNFNFQDSGLDVLDIKSIGYNIYYFVALRNDYVSTYEIKVFNNTQIYMSDAIIINEKLREHIVHDLVVLPYETIQYEACNLYHAQHILQIGSNSFLTMDISLNITGQMHNLDAYIECLI